ncbi:phytanoyl-CoA dioxygenase family protein [Parahaliea sp. F7430]|uniref:Phytanoyl-CoA dioxygenase family protein n=1 Tax=Sediminihaliea albiluteola TaxID=2758564 RepID=A0A7W2YKL4_9GAMM|nr:phytanoyl-CoA dioxygenase family protein [Sediminihaliea albiluteola]MBA6414290.1 phytanoyl-CoA dioxygenase family protein [Sediminihaliea albiluteola]
MFTNSQAHSDTAGDVLQRADHLLQNADFAAALDCLSQEQVQRPSPELEQKILDIRLAAYAQVDWGNKPEQWPPSHDDRFAANKGLAEIERSELDCESLAAGVIGAGGLIVRGLLNEQQVDDLKTGIDNTLLARRRLSQGEGEAGDERWYSRSERIAGGPAQFGSLGAQQYSDHGSVWAADSPKMAFELTALYARLGLQHLLANYFGEPAMLSVKKWVLRKVKPNPEQQAGWHQDGRFLGAGIRTVNMWIALSECGGDAAAPGMDIVADRNKVIHQTGTHGAPFDWTVGPGLVDQITRESPALNPQFQPGDALFFDQYNLHRTGFYPHHRHYRYAVESWFFAASCAPQKQMPLLF